MPISYVVNENVRVVWVRCRGDIAASALRAHWDRLQADTSFDSSFDRLVDLTHVTSLPSFGEVNDVLMHTRDPMHKTGRIAFLSRNETEFDQALQATWMMGTGRRESEVFRNPHDAIMWLRPRRIKP